MTEVRAIPFRRKNRQIQNWYVAYDMEGEVMLCVAESHLEKTDDLNKDTDP